MRNTDASAGIDAASKPSIVGHETILAIDPGPTESAYLFWNGTVLGMGITPNLGVVRSFGLAGFDIAAIEMIASYGMPVGKETFETCLWIGRMIERSPKEPILVYRKDIKMHFCQSMRAKDSNVRQAIIDRFGGKEKAIGKKGHYGPLAHVKSHLWSALAIALFVSDTKAASNPDRSSEL